ncbi:histamine N-methyltransferase isoform X1 [Danio rerio]|uniref:Histamine N-methyltransferase n=2 Tax=Danio rerio TaxID=7955 RepID=HNMT_DANRE|nr:histamine N-methyltransferase [Danio rerio]Q6DC37.1 RecName: Full=Histamine N-methyltransferase; Short=HMT [Danio rerio]AAH78250.1 Histamine N-methyltransferase [Danio rerio]|eukprot:NP_001003636.1 histamine N-methyltransferase [Danio rerio]
MAAPFKTLVEDYPRYLKSFELFLERSSEHQCMQDFIHNTLPDILASIGGGRSVFNVMGVGSGAGDIDLEMLAQLHLKHPHVKVDNEVVEPSNDMLYKYKARVSTSPDLAYINFTWNKMTASEFEKQWQEKTPEKKMDFIHMIQMLYYVKDPNATVSFFRSLLEKDGKLLIILVSGESGWGKLWTTFRKQLCYTEMSQCVTIGEIKSFLDSEGVPYRKYVLLSQMDITECFTEGDQEGELLLDFLTEVKEFSKNAPERLKKEVLDVLRHPDCSKEVDGRIIFNNNLEVLVIEP